MAQPSTRRERRRRRPDGASPRSPEWPGALAWRRGRRRTGARLNGDQTSLALRLGAVLILTPGYTNAVAGATALNVAGGMSGFAGTLAPEQLGEKPSFLCALRAAQRFVDHREALRNPPGPAETFSQFSKK